MSNLRWWARVVNKQNVIARSNDFYGIPDRHYGSTGTAKARTLDQEKLDQIKDPHVRMSLQLQAAFGLRREEALKIKPRQADEGQHLRLQASWTKGGKERTIPIRTEQQRQLLEQAKV
jgi:integrase